MKAKYPSAGLEALRPCVVPTNQGSMPPQVSFHPREVQLWVVSQATKPCPGEESSDRGVASPVRQMSLRLRDCFRCHFRFS
jgi:hypothetical protein